MTERKKVDLHARRALEEFKVEMSREIAVEDNTNDIYSAIMDVYKNRTSYEKRDPLNHDE